MGCGPIHDLMTRYKNENGSNLACFFALLVISVCLTFLLLPLILYAVLGVSMTI